MCMGITEALQAVMFGFSLQQRNARLMVGDLLEGKFILIEKKHIRPEVTFIFQPEAGFLQFVSS